MRGAIQPRGEQAKILALAAKLQAAYGETATASELEIAAAEAGIEPRFLRMAIEARREERTVSRDEETEASPDIGFVIAALLVFASQLYLA